MNRMLSIATAALGVLSGGLVSGVIRVHAEEMPVQVRFSDAETTPRASLPKMDDSAVFKLLLRSQPAPAKSAAKRQPWIPREMRSEQDTALAQASFLPEDGYDRVEPLNKEASASKETPTPIAQLKGQTTLFRSLWGPNDKDEASSRFPQVNSPTADFPLGPTVRMTSDEIYGERFIAGGFYTWSAPDFFHHPLYFEQVNLERYGQGPHHAIQPLYSAAHFFATIPVLPYHVATAPPSERVYTLGHHRPGNCAPYQWHRTRFSWKGVIVQGLATSGLAVALP